MKDTDATGPGGVDAYGRFISKHRQLPLSPQEEAANIADYARFVQMKLAECVASTEELKRYTEFDVLLDYLNKVAEKDPERIRGFSRGLLFSEPAESILKVESFLDDLECLLRGSIAEHRQPFKPQVIDEPEEGGAA